MPAKGGNKQQTRTVSVSVRKAVDLPAKENTKPVVKRSATNRRNPEIMTPVNSPKGGTVTLPHVAVKPLVTKRPNKDLGKDTNPRRSEMSCQTDDIGLPELLSVHIESKFVPFKSLPGKRKIVTASTQTPKLKLQTHNNLIQIIREIENIERESEIHGHKLYFPVVYEPKIEERLKRLAKHNLKLTFDKQIRPIQSVCSNYYLFTNMTQVDGVWTTETSFQKFNAGHIPLKYSRISSLLNVTNDHLVTLEPNLTFTFGLTPDGRPIREEIHPEHTVAQEPPQDYVPPPERPYIERPAKWYNRLLFNKESSKIYLDTLDQRKVGRLTIRKDNDGLGETVPSTLIDDKLRIYLLMQKWPEYKTRAATLDHMSKLARKYYPDELKVTFSSLTPEQVIRHHVTVQKVVDEHFVPFLLASEVPEDDRRQRIVSLKKRLFDRTGGNLFRHNKNFQ